MADNIITAVFGATRETKVRPRYRYDQGQVLMVRGVKNLPDFYEVHFANEGSTADATPLIGTAEGVEIPNSYFQSGATIYAYIYVHDEATDGTTVYKVTIPIINRARPANVEPTPEQEDIISQAIVALNENVGKSESAAERAESAADGVEDFATRAEAAAQAAETAAEGVEDYTARAETAARNAQSDASAAATARSRAETAQSKAETASSTAQQAANAAITARNTAQTAATSAQFASSNASSAATTARTYESRASDAATAATNAATRAETAAGQIIGMTAEAVTLAPGSAATASFLDGLLTLGIPAGETGATGAKGDPGPAGETGNGIVSIIKTGTQGNVDTYTITYTNGTTSTFTVTNCENGAVLSVAGKTGAVTLDAGDVEYDDTDTYAAGSVGAGLADLKSQMGAKASTDMALGAYPTDTVSGAVASFSDGGDNLPVKDLTIAIEPVQSGSGDPSPDNVRPISGWTGANINANGTTIPITFPSEAGTVYGGTLDVTTGVLTVDRLFTTIGDCAWSLISTYTYTQMFGTRSVMQLIDKSLDTVNKAKGLRCSIFKPVGRSYQYSHRNDNDSANTIAIITTGELYIASGGASTYADAAEFKAALSDTQLIYPLATPRTYQLTPVEVLILLGVNTIYADTGDSTVTYRADPTLYADKRTNATRSIIAGIEPTMKASKAYTTGDLLIVGDTLYKVAASIASGATLKPGTNVNATTVAEQLILLANA